MSTLKKVRWQLLLSLLVILLFSVDTPSRADEEKFEYGYCINLKLEDIPYGDFSQFAIPQAELVCPEDNQDCSEDEKIWQPVFRITQVYNQPESEKWESDSGAWLWGHDGIDLHEKKVVNGVTISARAGENAVIAIQGGKAVVTMWGHEEEGWGYRTTIATRIPYSHQILTVNYAHMHPNTLNYGKCATVQQGDILGREGKTGWGTGVHTHVTVRIWDNIEELKKALRKDDAVKEGESGYGLFQNGYARNNQAYLANYLSPYHLITGKFLEFECNDEGCPLWAKPHALAARRKGIDFGRYDGYFAVNTRDEGEPPVALLKKGESARWFKVGRQFITIDSSNTFTDVSNGSIHFPYVEALISNGVLSPDADCNPGQAGKQFCPDTNRPRIELLKMVVMTYMRDEYYQWLNAAKEGEMDGYFDGAINGQYFEDLYYDDGVSWFEHWGTTFVLFAAFNQHMQLIDVSQSFRINDPINKLEAVKLMMLAREWYYIKNEEGTQYTVCDYHYCSIDQTCVVEMSEEGYAEPVCIPMPACVPEEGEIIVCEYGGGLNDPCDNPECTPGVTKNQPCGNGGTQIATCTDECGWGSWGDCEGSGPCNSGQTLDCGNCGTMICGSNNQWGSCQNQGVCSSGQTQQQACNGSGTQTATCTNQCQWGAWGQCSCVCSSGTCCDGCNYKSSSVVCDSWYDYRCEGFNPGDDVERRELEQRCSGTSTNCNGLTNYGGWQTYQNCTSSQLCDDNYSPPQCVNGCSDTHYWSSIIDMETDNHGQQATQEINVAVRVEVQEDAQGLEFRVCKEGTFTDDVYFSIYDAMTHSSAGRTFTILSTAGKVCSNWMSMINDDNYLEGEVFGGTWKVVSPASSEPDWPNYSCVVNGAPTGTCWNGVNITLTRTCL